MKSKQQTPDDLEFLKISKTLMLATFGFCSPLWWEGQAENGDRKVHNGTAFFLRTETALFGVTAAHVLEGPKSWRWHRENADCSLPKLTGANSTTFEFNWDARVVDLDLDIDIATFVITESEIETIGRSIFTGICEQGQQNKSKWASYCGFPGAGLRLTSPGERTFGAATATGKIASFNDRDLHIQLEREDLEPVLGRGLPPENYDFGGISGGPVLRNIRTSDGDLHLVFAGVIRQGRGAPDELGQRIAGLELITARRSCFIRPDGSLDRTAWADLPG